MAVNLGNGFVELFPNWDRIDKRAVQKHLDRVGGDLKVGVDDAHLKKETTKVGRLLDRMVGKRTLTVDTRGVTREVEGVAKRLETSLASAGRKGGQSLGKGVQDALKRAADAAEREASRTRRAYEQAEEAKARAIEGHKSAQRKLLLAEEKLRMEQLKGNTSLETRLKLGHQIEEATTAVERAERTLGRTSREVLYYKRDMAEATEKAAAAARELETAEKGVQAQVSRTQRLLKTKTAMRIKTQFDKMPYSGIVKDAGAAGTQAGRLFKTRMETEMASVKANKAAAGQNHLMPNMRDTMRTVGVATAGYAGASFVTDSFRLTTDYEKRLSAIKAVSSADLGQMEKLSDKAMELGAKTKYTTSEAAEAIENLVKAGINVPDVLGGVAEATVNLAAAGEVPLSDAALLASRVKNAFGKEARDMVKIADLISGAANSSAVDVKDFGDSMKMVAAVANQNGMSVEDTAIAIAEMGNIGVTGSDAGTSLKTFMVNLNPTTTHAANTMEQYGLMSMNKGRATEALAQDGITGVDVDSGSSGFIQSLAAFYKKRDKVSMAAGKEMARKYMQENRLVDSAFYDDNGKFKGLRNAQVHLSQALKGKGDDERVRVSKDLFGTDAMRASGMMTDAGGETYDKVRTGIYKSTAKTTAETRQDNLASTAEQFGGSLENVRIKAFLWMMPALTDLMRKATHAMNDLAESGGKFNKYFPDAGDQLKNIGHQASVLAGALWEGFNVYAVPALKAFGAALVVTVLPVLSNFMTFLGDHKDTIKQWFIVWMAFVTPLVVKFLAVKGALIAFTIASKAFSVVMLAGRGAMMLWRAGVFLMQGAMIAARGSVLLFNIAFAATQLVVAGVKWAYYAAQLLIFKGAQLAAATASKVFAVSQMAVNAVLALNPIGLVIFALVALGLAFIIAYRRSDTFRRIVNKAWAGIRKGAGDAWSWMSKKVFSPMKTFFLETIPNAADTMQRKFGEAWEKIKWAANNPVLFIVKTVYQEGLRAALSKIPGAGKILPDATSIIKKLEGRKDGGTIPGRWSATNRDNVLGVDQFGMPTVRVEPEEFVTNRKATKQSRRLLEAINMGKINDRVLRGLAGGGYVNPVPGGSNRHSRWKYPWATFAGDFPVGMNTPVKSWKDGIIAAVKHLTYSYGEHVRINHPDGSSSLYAHLNRIMAQVGQQVSMGQVIGLSGTTGNSTGPHLHFETTGSPYNGGSGDSGGGGASLLAPFTDAINSVREKFNGMKEKFGDWGELFSGVGPTIFSGVLSKGKEKIGEIASQVMDTARGARDTVNTLSAKAAVRAVAMTKGWAFGDQWDALNQLVSHESSWNPRADNPSSTAYGLFQLLYEPGTTIPYGQQNETRQAVDGTNYISDRYGSPVAAWDFWQKHNWYSKGTLSALPGMAMIDERGDEWINFRGGERVMPHGQTPKAGTQRLVGQIQITNWETGMAEFRGDLVDEMDWRGSR